MKNKIIFSKNQIKELRKDAETINKALANLKAMSKLEKRASCKRCKHKQVWKADNGDFICVAKLKKPIRHTELGLSKDNIIRKCANIKGVGRRVEEMDEAECVNIMVLYSRLLKEIGVLNKHIKLKKNEPSKNPR